MTGGGTGEYFGYGGDGIDRFEDSLTGAGTMLMDGGAGYDVVSFTSTTGVQITLSGTVTQGTTTRTYARIEGAAG